MINSNAPIIWIENQRNSQTYWVRLYHQLERSNHNPKIQKRFDIIGPMVVPKDKDTINLTGPIKDPVCRRVSILSDKWKKLVDIDIPIYPKGLYVVIISTCIGCPHTSTSNSLKLDSIINKYHMLKFVHILLCQIIWSLLVCKLNDIVKPRQWYSSGYISNSKGAVDGLYLWLAIFFSSYFY